MKQKKLTAKHSLNTRIHIYQINMYAHMDILNKTSIKKFFIGK